MKKILHLFFIAVLLSGCEKEVPASLRLMGSWSIKSIWPQDLSRLDFVYGELIINQDYSASYRVTSDTYDGTWRFDETSEEDCYTDQDNNRNCTYNLVESLQVEVFHSATQKRKSAYFAELQFTNDDNFTATTYNSGITYKYNFERKQ
jgi:hypothetical protein